jgi:hypothetical protein
MQADAALCPFRVLGQSRIQRPELLRVWETEDSVRKFYLQRLQLGIDSTLQDGG